MRPSNELVATRTFSTKFNDLEPLEKKENILPVRYRLSVEDRHFRRLINWMGGLVCSCFLFRLSLNCF